MDSLKISDLAANGVLIQENSEITDLSVENGDPLTMESAVCKEKTAGRRHKLVNLLYLKRSW